jgi:hypothetical protein
MPKPSRAENKSKPRGRKYQDANQFAYDVLQQTIAKSEGEPAPVTPSVISQVMAAMGSKGGKKGGKTRMAMMTSAERSKLATKAVNARWAAKRKAS